MHYVIFDLEFNQDFSSLKGSDRKGTRYPFEIIQIGAIKLDLNFDTVATFNRYVKPSIYKEISPFITGLTGITTEQLQTEESFPEVYEAYTTFIGDVDSVFCIWGMSDIKELFRNVNYHELNNKLLPKLFINLQPLVSIHLGLPSKNLLRLQYAVETLNIPITSEFHDALNDAYYTAELFKKIYNSSILPRFYDPTYVITKPRQPKKVLDVDKLIQQFEKMYAREMTEEEKDIIELAYKMGKTNQFIK